MRVLAVTADGVSTSVPAVSTPTVPTGGTGAAAPAIELIGVAKDYASRRGAVTAVETVDLQIAEGEFFSLLGPSGCGKTTTLRMIGGFEEPSRGQILLHGSDVTATPPNRRDVNLVFQSYALFPHLDVAGNVAFGLKRKGIRGQAMRDRVTNMLELVELGALADRKPKELSGGQQQRVALARALVNEPRALLLDEPLGALDLKLRETMQIELKRIQREVGITFVYVTHDQSEALTMSDRIAVMNKGRIEQLAAPRDLYERPRTRFVAGFIGTSNVLRRTVKTVTTDGTGPVAILDAGIDEQLMVPLHDDLGSVTTGSVVELTVRPEKIGMTVERPDGDVCLLRGRVTEVVYLGTNTTYTVFTPGGDEITVFWQNSSDSADIARRGDEVWLSWREDHSFALAPGAGSSTPAAA
ncbi:ABC transporter ATP-binding protein [Pseudofrankia inefficax]|uniref:Spermidine/putrescine import ATP-binding protein PotA n=1 Tax=Pseudofrankia inefficax (strain DSM 45817 / CECT 9037 / DDB 130130 / EuI1c) TaxID=298654 RepID=E3J282_PSEI1|nr:ABC transporter ATP-binding protein [Pseudofrankia inefficax]ADP78120.1 spermidine/putrescine ABC transporter ATPase subunit [Pseudofrankia inefficax]